MAHKMYICVSLLGRLFVRESLVCFVQGKIEAPCLKEPSGSSIISSSLKLKGYGANPKFLPKREEKPREEKMRKRVLQNVSNRAKGKWRTKRGRA